MSVTLEGFSITKPGSAPTAVAGSASGNLDASAAYNYKITFVTAFGETDPSSAGTVTTSSTGSVNLSAIPVSDNENVIARRIYRTEGGLTVYYLLAQIDDNVTTTYTDITADATLTSGAAIPTSNSAHSRSVLPGIVGLSLPTIYSIDAAITATAGGGQTNAYQITKEINIVTISATTGDSVKLPELNSNLVGMHILVANDGANSVNVFPASGQNASGGVNTAVAVAAAARAEFVAKNSTTWVKTR